MSMSSNGLANMHGRATSLDIVVPLDLPEWLMLSRKAIQNNLPIIIPPGGTVDDYLHPDGKLQYVLLDAHQFDGVQSGQVSFEFMSGRQRVAGYAVQAYIQPELLLSEKGTGIHYRIVSAQTTQAVVNIDYLSIESHVVDNEIRPALDHIRIGAR